MTGPVIAGVTSRPAAQQAKVTSNSSQASTALSRGGLNWRSEMTMEPYDDQGTLRGHYNVG
jgi:cytochrome c2